MKIYTFVIALTLISVITSDLVANDPSDATNARAYSIPTADAPELAVIGPYTAGVTSCNCWRPGRRVRV